MKLKAIKTDPIIAGEELIPLLDQYIPPLENAKIVAITSKLISLCQGRVIEKNSGFSKYELITKEADGYLTEGESLYDAHLTIKNNILIPSAGIDESNGNGQYILYPLDVQETARKIWHYLCEKHNLKDLGVIITDSHTTPLRKGVTGIALGWCGFEPLYSYVGKPDIFNTPLQVTQINILDALAASSVFVMGEGAEQTPIVLIEDVPRIKFLTRSPTAQEENEIHISIEEDIYAPLLKKANWIWNRDKNQT